MIYTLTCLGCTLFFFNDTATTEIYTLSLHDALPISCRFLSEGRRERCTTSPDLLGSSRSRVRPVGAGRSDRKSTRLNSSHMSISYAVFCLKKKKNKQATEHVLAIGSRSNLVPPTECG